MYFVLSKVLLFLLDPLYWILALLITGLVLKNKQLKKRFFIASAAVFLLFSIPIFLDQFANRWDYYADPSIDSTKYSCVIVLGGFSGPGRYDNGYFNSSADRFIQGAKLLITGRASHILISGANGFLLKNSFIEADWVKTQLKAFKVPDSVILTENRSRNTIENAAYTKIILQNRHLPPPYLLVTSAFHMRRSVATFKKAGLNVVPYPCNFIAGGGFGILQLVPNAGVLYKWNTYIKEVTGYVVLWFKK